LIPPSSSQKILANVALSTQEVRNRLPKNSNFVIFFPHSKVLTSIA